MRLTTSRAEQKIGHNLHYLTDTGVPKNTGVGLNYRYYSLPCILSYVFASRPCVLQLLLDPTDPTSGFFFRVKLLLFLLLICGSRLCILGVIYPWPLAIWVVTVIILVQYRFALQRKVLGIIRINKLLNISFTISILLGAVYGCARYLSYMDNESTLALVLWDPIHGSLSGCVVLFLGIELFLSGGVS